MKIFDERFSFLKHYQNSRTILIDSRFLVMFLEIKNVKAELRNSDYIYLVFL